VTGLGQPVPGPARGKRRQLPGAWTGITEPDCHDCAWSWHDGRREVKFRNTACTVHQDTTQADDGGDAL
jgi:hypothetical protein